jgi:hypothetical protein
MLHFGEASCGEAFSEEDHQLYEAGLIGVLREIHDELDRTVFAAYGWPETLTDDEILARIVALNAERRAEEASGLVRWLRPESQAPNAVAVTPTLAGFVDEAPVAGKAKKQPWPAAIPYQFRVVRDALCANAQLTPAQIAVVLRPASRNRVAEILLTLVALGHVRSGGDR